MRKWYTLFKVENPGTDWKQKVWLFSDLSRKEKRELIKDGWRVSGNQDGEFIGEGEAYETNKNRIRIQKKRF